MDTLPNPNQSAFNSIYPSPPHVNLSLLVLIFTLAEISVGCLSVYGSIPEAAMGLLTSVVLYAWPVYLCLWMKKLNPKSFSLFFLLACVAVNTIIDLVSASSDPLSFSATSEVQIVIGMAPFFVMRDELVKHYTEREPIALKLNFFMTLLFSFFYFQKHLNKIAEEKNNSLQNDWMILPKD